MKVKHMLRTLMDFNPEEEIICIWYDKSFIEASIDGPIPVSVWEKAVNAADCNVDSYCDLIVDEIESQVTYYRDKKVTV